MHREDAAGQPTEDANEVKDTKGLEGRKDGYNGTPAAGRQTRSMPNEVAVIFDGCTRLPISERGGGYVKTEIWVSQEDRGQTRGGRRV